MSSNLPTFTPLQLQALTVLSTASGLSAGELSVRLGRSRTHTATVLRSLTHRGLVSMNRTRAEDGRSTARYRLTATGHRAMSGEPAA